MPRFRKVGPDEAALWDAQPKAPKPHDDRYAWAERPAVLFVRGQARQGRCAPCVGDVLPHARGRRNGGGACDRDRARDAGAPGWRVDSRAARAERQRAVGLEVRLYNRLCKW